MTIQFLMLHIVRYSKVNLSKKEQKKPQITFQYSEFRRSGIQTYRLYTNRKEKIGTENFAFNFQKFPGFLFEGSVIRSYTVAYKLLQLIPVSIIKMASFT